MSKLYTIGETETYLDALAENGEIFKHAGAICFLSIESAKSYIRSQKLEGYSVFRLDVKFFDTFTQNGVRFTTKRGKVLGHVDMSTSLP